MPRRRHGWPDAAMTLFVLALAMPACRMARGNSATQPPADGAPVEWTAYGRDAEGTRYAPVADITRGNVARLRIAWTYRTRESEPEFATRRETSFEATPLVVDGAMYLGTPLGRVIALDPETGAERWTFNPEPPVDRTLGFGDFTNRGVSTWVDPTAPPGDRCQRRIYIATIDARLIALAAHDGRPCTDFGTHGTVDLRRGLRIVPFETEAYEMTSPPAVINGLVVTGSAIADNSRLATASGEVRAFDARTGALRWSWDPVPQDSTDPAFATWTQARGERTGAANAWSVIVADSARDLVFVPTGSASPDYYGGERLGSNRYANSLIALRASTGRVVWHFQSVHHDLWDYDNAAPPALATLTRDDRATPAVLLATKTGQLFVLHRETGEPIFPVEERPVPRSTVPGEQAWPTQPFTAVTPPLSPHRADATQPWGMTAAERDSCRAMMTGLRNEGIFTPPSLEGTLVIPSNVGGAHWGGVAIDPVRQIAVVPVNRVAAVVQLIPREKLDTAAARNEASRLGTQFTRMRGTPYVLRRRLLLSPSRMPCTPPPFGALVAVSLRTGGRLWEVPLGGAPAMLPDSVRRALPPDLGSINLGGPIVTAGGVIFIGATLDRGFRAFDIETGHELWRAELPAGARATPMTYRVGGRQYVAIAAGGGSIFGSGDWVTAFALPKE